MPLIQRLHKMNTTKPKTKSSTKAMQGKMGMGSLKDHLSSPEGNAFH